MHLVPRMATALVFFLYVRNEGLDQAHAQDDREPEIMCGEKLTNAIQLVCNGIYNPMYKKSEGTHLGPESALVDEEASRVSLKSA